MVDPNRWQPLALDEQISQNGLPIPGTVQTSSGRTGATSRRSRCRPRRKACRSIPGHRRGSAIRTTDEAFKQDAVIVLGYSNQLDSSDGVEIDISPGALGDNSLGTNDGDGHDVNPSTGEPYEPNVVLRGDYGRALAEYWADGPKSETPPGHWNVIANAVTDSPGFERRIGGAGEELDALEWDVKLYFALNGAVHDAAVAAWGLKGNYDSAGRSR